MKVIPLDKILGGGLKRGHILEISGPPGSAKELMARNIVQSFLEANHQVLFIGKFPLSSFCESRANLKDQIYRT